MRLLPAVDIQASEKVKLQEQALREQKEAEEAARLSHLISEDVRKKEEMRLDRERRERELDRERDNASLEVGPNGEKTVNMPIFGPGGKADGIVRFGFPLADGAPQRPLTARKVTPSDQYDPQTGLLVYSPSPIERRRKKKPAPPSSSRSSHPTTCLRKVRPSMRLDHYAY